MIELKTYKMVDEKYCTDCVCVIPSEVYLKKDADTAIATLRGANDEKAERIVELQKQVDMIKEKDMQAPREEMEQMFNRQYSQCKELKATTAYDAYWKATSNGDNSISVYFKSEVDKVIEEKDAEIRKLNFQMWSARCEAAEAECDEPRLARCRYMADKFKEVTK